MNKEKIRKLLELVSGILNTANMELSHVEINNPTEESVYDCIQNIAALEELMVDLKKALEE